MVFETKLHSVTLAKYSSGAAGDAVACFEIKACAKRMISMTICYNQMMGPGFSSVPFHLRRFLTAELNRNSIHETATIPRWMFSRICLWDSAHIVPMNMRAEKPVVNKH